VGDKPAAVVVPKPQAAPAATGADAVKPDAKKATALLQKNGCTVCHGMSNKIVGPAYTDVAKKHEGKADYLVTKIKAGGVGIWGPIPMPAQTLSESDARVIAVWLAAGMPK
jgi:cytochrome c